MACNSFNAIATAYNYLRILENAEDGLALDKTHVLNTMPRLGHRQFEWQQPAANLIDLYRSLFLFGGPVSAAYFRGKYGLEPDQFVLCGFLAYMMFGESTALLRDQNHPDLGVTSELFNATINLIARPISAMRQEASRMREGHGHVGYKPSVLRRFPCLLFDDRLRVPLRELLFTRITSGLYYDVIIEGGAVPREIGGRFEKYCFGLIESAWKCVDVEQSFKYQKNGRGNPVDTPDLRLRRGGETHIIVECKAKRMPLATRFGEDPMNDPQSQAGFDEVAKGIFQIWRFRSHARQGFAPNEPIHVDVIGVVITLDNWLSMTRGRYDELVARAISLADANGDIIEVDRCPVAFCSVSELEQALSTATFDSFLATASEIASAEFAGWQFCHVHDRHVPNGTEPRPYPFADRVCEVLPWWDSMGE